MTDDLDALLAETAIRAPRGGNWSGHYRLEISDPELARQLAAHLDTALHVIARGVIEPWSVVEVTGPEGTRWYWAADDRDAGIPDEPMTAAHVAVLAAAETRHKDTT